MSKLAEDRHEDNDVKSSHQDIFHELKAAAKHEHKDYTPLQSPVYYDPDSNKAMN